MNNTDLANELRELVTATKEHFKYIQELGVEFLEIPNGFSVPDKIARSETSPVPLQQIGNKVSGSSLSAAGKPQPAQVQAEGLSQFDNLFGDIPPKAPSISPSNESFETIWAEIGNCTRCTLHQGRTHIVHTEGDRKARLMFVGEAPGADEDIQARPFVGKAGQLLTKIIESIGFKREEVMIGNINRCRPPGNRAPTTDEAETCRPYLLREIAVVQPEVIVVLGNTAIKNLLGAKEGVTRLRGRFQDYNGIKVMPTFHPAYLLRDPSKKRETWEDLKMVRDYLDQTVRG